MLRAIKHIGTSQSMAGDTCVTHVTKTSRADRIQYRRRFQLQCQNAKYGRAQGHLAFTQAWQPNSSRRGVSLAIHAWANS